MHFLSLSKNSLIQRTSCVLQLSIKQETLANCKGFQSVARGLLYDDEDLLLISSPGLETNSFKQQGPLQGLALVFCLIETFLESLCSFTPWILDIFFLHQSAQYFTFLNLCGEVRTRSGKEVVVRARNEKRSRSTVGSNSSQMRIISQIQIGLQLGLHLIYLILLNNYPINRPTTLRTS